MDGDPPVSDSGVEPACQASSVVFKASRALDESRGAAVMDSPQPVARSVAITTLPTTSDLRGYRMEAIMRTKLRLLESIRADNLAASLRAEGSPDAEVDRVFDEFDRAVSQQEFHA